MKNENDAIYWMSLALSRRRFQRSKLLNFEGGLERVFNGEHRRVAKELGVVVQTVLKWRRVFQSGEPERLLTAAQGLGQWICCYPDLPRRLRTLEDAPPILFGVGEPLSDSGPCIAVVGSRRATPYGMRWADTLSRELARLGVMVVSGGAVGIDAAAHGGALRGGGRTVVVGGCGLDVPYPAGHRALFEQVVAEGGCRISEFAPGVLPRPAHFPGRNRLISGLSLGVVVVEAAQRSGALCTARIAAEQGREVFVIPGSLDSPVSVGCHALIQEGATLVTGAEQIVEQVFGQLVQTRVDAPSVYADLGKEARSIISALSGGLMSTDMLVQHTGLSAGQVLGRLLTLELDGRIAKCDDGLYRLGNAARPFLEKNG